MKKILLFCLTLLLTIQLVAVSGISATAQTTDTGHNGHKYTYTDENKTAVTDGENTYTVVNGQITLSDESTWLLVDEITDIPVKAGTYNLLFMDDIEVFSDNTEKQLTVTSSGYMMILQEASKTRNTSTDDDETAVAANCFSGILEGNGYSIKNCNVSVEGVNKGSIVALIQWDGTIRNLSFGTSDDPIVINFTAPANQNQYFGLVNACTYSSIGAKTGLQLSNVTVWSNLTLDASKVTSKKVAAAPFCAALNMTNELTFVFDNVTSNGSLTVTSSTSTGTSSYTMVGGVVGGVTQGSKYVSSMQLSNVINGMDINVTVNADGQTAVGGIISDYPSGTLQMTNCLNTGKIVLTGTGSETHIAAGLCPTEDADIITVTNSYNVKPVVATNATALTTYDKSAAEVAYKFGKAWGCDLSDENAIPVKGSTNYVAWDFMEEKYINTQNVLSKNDTSEGNTSNSFAGYYQKHNDGGKIRILAVGTEADFEALGEYKLRTTFTIDGTEKVIEATYQQMGAFYSVVAAGETFYAEYGQCIIGFVIKDIPDDIFAKISPDSVKIELIEENGYEIVIADGTK